MCDEARPDADAVAMDTAVPILTIPVLPLVEDVFGVKHVQVRGDNQARLSVMKTVEAQR